MSGTNPAADNPAVHSLDRLLQRLPVVGTETVDWRKAAGRVLAEPVRADRDSPPLTVSAMDGYACRVRDALSGRIEVAGEAKTGQAPMALPPGRAMKIFTGASVPEGAELVIRREDVGEAAEHIVVRDPAALKPGDHLRHRGENLRAGEEVLPPGTPLHAPAVAALATFGVLRPCVFRRVRVGILVTGDELVSAEEPAAGWQIRDSNSPALLSMFGSLPWIEILSPRRAADEPEATRRALSELLSESDVVLLTGGVSMGDHDYVPAAVQAAGGDVVFHRLPIRPGRPILAATGRDGQAILGLPGNPVSVMVTGRRFGAAALRRRGGFARPMPQQPVVRVRGAIRRAPGLWWSQPVQLVGPGEAELVINRGSGDIPAAARSDGFVEAPPSEVGAIEPILSYCGWEL